MNGSFYESIGNNTISVNGLISWSDSAGVDYALYLLVVNNGTIKTRKILDTFLAATDMTERRYVVSEQLNLTHMDNVAIVVSSEATSEAIEVVFSTESGISVLDKSTDAAVKSSECYGLSAYDAFVELGKKMGLSGVESEFFRVKKGFGDFITNGNNIRGVLSPINVSFAWLFDQMKVLYDIEANLSGGVVRIEKAENATNANSIDMGEVKSEFAEMVNIDTLFSSVRAGYRTWQSESKLKGAEFNSIRVYETELEFGSREMPLVMDIITSSYIIEEQRRLQFDTEKKRDGAKYDESVFLIATDNGIVEGIEKYSPIGNIVASGGVYNFKYSPTAIIENNRRVLYNSGVLKLASSEGNSVAIVKGLREDRGFVFTDNMPYMVDFELEIEPYLFDGLRYLAVEVDGKRRFVKLLEAQMSLSTEGKGIVNILGEVA